MATFDLSVVLPALREKKIEKRIVSIYNMLSKSSLSFEMVVVVDGGDEETFAAAKKVVRNNFSVYKLSKNFGKGYAVCYGMKKAKGEAVAFIDAGGELDPKLLVFFWYFLKATSADIVVGSKLHPASKVSYPFIRKILSRGYQFLTRILFGLWVRDTQVGIKMMRRQVVRKVVPRLLVKSYAFDVEMLAVATHLGFKKIYEAPVSLKWKGGIGLSSKKIWFVIFRMRWDTLAVFYRLRILRYYD